LLTGKNLCITYRCVTVDFDITIRKVKGRVSILFCIFYHPPSKAKSFSTVSSRGPECPSNSRV
ncbi:hypothetical protein X798_01155, partial [Onchocerca flexuosa]